MFWSVIDKSSSIIFPFIIRTILIYTLGVQYVGINGLFSSILQVLSLADLGFSSAIVYSMYRPIAIGDKKYLNALLMFYRKVYRIIGIVILILGLVILPFMKYLIKGTYPNDINIYIIYLIFLFNTTISYFLFAYKKAILIAHQRKDIMDRIIIGVRSTLNILQIVVLLSTKNYYLYIIIMPVITIVDNILCSRQATKIYPDLLCKGEIEKEEKVKIIEKVKGLLVYKIVGVTRNALDNIFLSAFLGITTVGKYANYFLIMTSIRGFMDVITTSMSASIGNSVATESVDKNYNDLNIFTFLYAWICGWCTVCLYVLYQPFMILWVGKENLFPMPVVAAFSIYFYVWTAGDIRSQYTDACGLWWKEKNRSIVEAIFNIILNYCLVKIWGVFGIIIATAISIGIIGIPWCSKIIFDNYFKNKNVVKFLAYHMFYAIVTIIVVCFTYTIASFIEINGINGFIIKGIICLFVPNICYLTIYFKSKYFKESLEFIKTKLLSK